MALTRQQLAVSGVPFDHAEGSKGLVILGFAESFSSPEVTWSLVEAGFSVVAFARRHSGAALRSSRMASIFDVTPPESDASATIREIDAGIARLLDETGMRASLLVLDDAALWIKAHLRPHRQLVFVGPSEGRIALNKGLQIESARQAGFRVPETSLLDGAHAPSGAALPFPLILKPNDAISLKDGRLHKGSFHICRTAAQYEAAVKALGGTDAMLAQQYVSGVGEGLFGLATKRGVLAWSAHRRLRMMNPAGSGASACISITPDAAAIAAGTRFIAQAHWTGPFMIELIRDQRGEAWFMEFNGRIWGSTALARRCGLEYPAWAVGAAMERFDGIPNSFAAPSGVVCRHAGRELIHGLFALRGRPAGSPANWPSRWTTWKSLLHFRGSDQWYNWKTSEWRVFIRDIFATVAENCFKTRKPKGQ